MEQMEELESKGAALGGRQGNAGEGAS